MMIYWHIVRMNGLKSFVDYTNKKSIFHFIALQAPNLVDEELVKLLKSTGCVSINMSIEAANPHFRNQVLKRNISNEEIENAFSVFYKYNIKTFSNNILGLPYSKIEDDISTVDMNIKCKITFAEFPICHPYPGTELGKYCEEKGIFNKDYDSLHMSYQHRSPLSCFSDKEKKYSAKYFTTWISGIMVSLCQKHNNEIFDKFSKQFCFFTAYLFAKIYLVKTKIYPFKLKFADFFELFKRVYLLINLNIQKKVINYYEKSIDY